MKAIGQPVCPFRQDIAQLGEAPTGQRGGIGHPGDHEPVIAIGDDRMFVTRAGELLRRQRGALARVQAFGPVGEAILVDQVDGGGLVAPIGLDQRVLVSHVAAT